MQQDLASVHADAQALLGAGRPDAVEALLRPYLAGGRGPLALWRLMAAALQGQGRFAQVREIRTMLVDTVPGDLAARYDLAETLLLLGDFARGWREYRFRYSLPHTKCIARKMPGPRWEGEKLPGRALFVHDEQGFGDTFQFVRLLRPAAKRAQAGIVFEVNPESHMLMQRSFPEFEILPCGALPPPCVAHCELMSLPMALGLRLEDLPGALPYLRPDPARLARWRQRLSHLPRPLVALAWAGRPSHPNDVNRSMALSALAPLAASGLQFLSLQKGPAAEQALAPPEGLKLEVLSEEIRDFDDTAAILCIADLLVSVDSSPVHLAGALGRPAWVMLPFIPEWRWMLGSADTPWYPQHRLFRQKCPGDWPGMAAQLVTALQAWAANPRGT